MKQKGKKILVCDDNVQFLRTVGEIIKFQGYEPIIAKTGRQALEKAINLGPDLVLLDYRLPDMDGYAVLRELRTADSQLPVIIMTGYGHEKLAAEVIKLGAMDYLAKPFKSGELLESIEGALKKVDEMRKKEELEKLVFWGMIRNRHQNDETTARSLQIIHEEIVRLNEFVNQCLDFSRSPSKEGFSFIDLNEAVSSCIQLMAPVVKSPSKRLEVKTGLDTSLPKAYANMHEIKQVLINLLRNAVEAIPKQGAIIVETHHKKDNSDGFAEIKVTDNGVGVGDEDLANVFNPFFSKKRSGIGLGLAICKKIIEENHLGHLSIESRPSKGTTVTVILPIGGRKGPPREAA